jgi:ribose transport system substrate-binding protein
MRTSVRIAAAILPLAMLAAACGSDAGETTETKAPAAEGSAAPEASAAPVESAAAPAEGGDDAGVQAAKDMVASISAPPAKIGPTIPLSGKPEKKTVAWLECELPSCTAITPGFKEATAALGWDLKVIPVGSFTPQEAFQQAIDAKVDFVAITGTPAATIQPQIDAAKAAGIGFGSCYSTDRPSAEANILIQCGDDTGVKVNGAIVANWAIADSGGKANTLIVNIPDFPVLVAEADGAKEAYAANCPACTVQDLDLTIDQLIAGEIPAAVVSKLQSDPSINYIHYAFGDLPAGVLEAIEAAGLTAQVKNTGVDAATGLGFKGISEGTHSAWTVNPKPYAGWLIVDAFARASLGMDNPEERANAILPTFIVDNKAAADAVIAAGPDGWPGPDGYGDQFKTLWGV